MANEPVRLSVALEPEGNAECAAMNALDQIMAWLVDTADAGVAAPRIAAWFAAKYGQARREA